MSEVDSHLHSRDRDLARTSIPDDKFASFLLTCTLISECFSFLEMQAKQTRSTTL